MSPTVIGLVAHTGKSGAGELVWRLAKLFHARGLEVLFETESARLAGEAVGYSVAELGTRCGIIVALGGDGTILRVLHRLAEVELVCPVFGINLGSLGFLTCVGSQHADQAVELICSGQFLLSERTLLAVTVERAGQIVARSTGLNDAVISRGELSRLIKLDTWIDGVELTQYNADGLIVATPTGSTAYSLAAGGPILMPISGVFVVTPICPHVLTNRSVIVGDESKIVVRPLDGETRVTLTVDGQDSIRIQQGEIIRIGKSPLKLPLAMLAEPSFCEVLRQKLKWSGSAV